MIPGPEGQVTSRTRRTIHPVTREPRKMSGLLRKNIPEIWGGGVCVGWEGEWRDS